MNLNSVFTNYIEKDLDINLDNIELKNLTLAELIAYKSPINDIDNSENPIIWEYVVLKISRFGNFDPEKLEYLKNITNTIVERFSGFGNVLPKNIANIANIGYDYYNFVSDLSLKVKDRIIHVETEALEGMETHQSLSILYNLFDKRTDIFTAYVLSTLAIWDYKAQKSRPNNYGDTDYLEPVIY